MLSQASVPHRSAVAWATVSRLRVATLSIAAIGVLFAAPQTAWAQVREGARFERVLQTDDDWQIYITYYPAPGEKEGVTKESPVVVLLHGDKENRLVWEGEGRLASRLQQQGYAVITVDLRKHGQSTNVARLAGDSPAGGKSTDGTNLHDVDYQNMVNFDMEAVKKFIYEQHQAKKLNMRKMAIVGAESSAAVALYYAVADWSKEPYDDAPSDELKTPRGQDVRALVLLSPAQKVKGLPLGEVVGAVRNPDWNIAFATMCGKLNRTDDKDAVAIHHKLFGTTKANEDRIYLIRYNTNARGTTLLGRKEIEAESTIIKFFAKHLRLADSEWRDRQSRLTKK